jgi:putative transposase
MARKRFTPEQIIGMLREAEVRLSQGEKVKGAAEMLGSRSRPTTVGARITVG